MRSKPATDGPFVAEFIETFCRQTEGERAGSLIRLGDWQRQLLADLFELRPDGRRRYRQALIGMPRKNGKSSLGAGLALYLLLMDGEQGAEVYSCAGDRDQARIVFGTAKRMVELEPELEQRLRVYRDAIEHQASGSVYRVLSAEAYTKEGLNPSGVIFDELHVQPSRELWDVMTMGSGTRRQPLVMAITTAGYDLDTICGEKYTYGRRVQAGEVDDSTFFFRWWTPKKAGADYRDPKVWAEANPALGDFLYVEDLEQAARQVPEHTFRRYRLNEWTSTAQAWLPYGSWDLCRDESLTLDPALPLRVAVDMALRNDSAAVVCAQQQAERVVLQARIWENPHPEGTAAHEAWSFNVFEVENHLKELYQRFPTPATEIDGKVMAGPEFCYDPAYFERSAQVLAGDGLAMVEFPQTDSRMIPASQNLYQLVAEGKLAHDGDTKLARQVANAVADQKPRGWRLTKPKGSRKKIDACVAAAIAAFRCQQPLPVVKRSRYEAEDARLVTF